MVSAAAAKAAEKKRAAAKQLQATESKRTRGKSSAPPPSSQVEEIDDDISGEETDEVTQMGMRPIVAELFITKDFLTEFELTDVMGLLEAQGWGNMFQEEVAVDEDLVQEFYENLEIDEKKGNFTATFTIGGRTHVLTHRELAKILDVPDEGSAEYIKGVWPATKTKAEIIQRVGEDPSNFSKPGKASKLGIFRRTLLKVIQHNITPRMHKHHVVNYNDFLLLDKLLRKEQINLAKVIMLHMQHITTLGQAMAYSSVVKKVLIDFRLYKPGVEAVVSVPMKEEMFVKLGWSFDDIEGWYNEKHGLPAVPVSAAAPNTVKIEPGLGEDSAVLKTLNGLMDKMTSLEVMMTKFVQLAENVRTDPVTEMASVLKDNTSMLCKLVGQFEELRKEVKTAIGCKDLVPVSRDENPPKSQP